jgi:hypothetical protein
MSMTDPNQNRSAKGKPGRPYTGGRKNAEKRTAPITALPYAQRELVKRGELPALYAEVGLPAPSISYLEKKCADGEGPPLAGHLNKICLYEPAAAIAWYRAQFRLADTPPIAEAMPPSDAPQVNRQLDIEQPKA